MPASRCASLEPLLVLAHQRFAGLCARSCPARRRASAPARRPSSKSNSPRPSTQCTVPSGHTTRNSRSNGCARRSAALDLGVDAAEIVGMDALGKRLVGAGEGARRQAPQLLVSARPGDAVCSPCPSRTCPCAPRRAPAAGALRFRAGRLGLAPDFELRHHLTAQRRQAAHLRGGERARHAIRDAQRAERVAPRREQRRAGVEPDACAPVTSGLSASRGSIARVGDDQRFRARRARGRRRRVARRLGGSKPTETCIRCRVSSTSAMKAIGVWQIAAASCSELGEGRRGRRVDEGVLPESCEAVVLIGGAAGRIHQQP